MSQENEFLPLREENEQIVLACYSVIGDRREQQDEYLYQLTEDGAWALICDGMGGQKGGSAAARIAVKTVAKACTAGTDPQECLALILRAVREADARIAVLTDEQGAPLGAGSTVTAVIVRDRQLGWCSVGDSRAYLMRGENLVQITRDQNYQNVLDAQYGKGLIGEDEFRSESLHGDALISYLGIGGLQLIDYSSRFFPLEAGDRLLLVSDGLYRLLSDEDICGVLKDFVQPKEALAVLERKAAEQAKKSGMLRDNTTAVLLKIK